MSYDLSKCLIALLLFSPLLLRAQILEEDTIKADTRYGSLFYTADRYDNTAQLPDTALTWFSRYSPLYAHKYSWDYAPLNIIGQATRPTVFEYDRTVGFDMGWHNYDPYRLHPDSVRYFTSPFPFSAIKYVLGPAEEQFLTAELGIPIKRNWHINTLYRLMVGEGDYNRQHESWHNTYISTNYEHPKMRYRLKAFYLLNNAENEQNGGIQMGSNGFDQSPRTILSPYLSAAADAWNEHHFSLQQSLDGGTLYDIVKEDTTITKLFTTRRMGHRIAYQSYTRRYTDSQIPENFYNNTFFSPTQSNDSMQWHVLQNEFFLGINGKRLLDTSQYHPIPFESTFQARVGFLHELISIDRVVVTDTLLGDSLVAGNVGKHIHSGILQGHFQNRPDSRLHYWADGQYVLFGYNIADFAAQGGIQLRLSDNIGGIRGKIALKNITPAFITQQYNSNTAIWQNDFRKTQSLQFWATYFNDPLHLTLTYSNHTFTNLIAWNEQQQPEQFDNIVNVSQLEAKHQLRWGIWRLDNSIALQIPSDSRLRMPFLVGRHALYIESGIFKNKSTKIQVGIEVGENTRYAANAYAPDIGQFYRQATDTLTYYPVIDIFAHVKVKRVRLFLKMSHVNQGIAGMDGYFIAPNYPAYDRAFRFGLIWLFFD
jgi:hypothetical protein